MKLLNFLLWVGVLGCPLAQADEEVQNLEQLLLHFALHGSFAPKVEATPSEHVTVLTEETVKDFISNSEDAAMVLFYAPWCHFSREFLKSFDTAANLLQHQRAPIKLGKIDASASASVQSDYKITAYPTVIIFLDGHQHEYTGGRQHQQVVKWVSEFLQTEVTITSSEHLDALLDAHSEGLVVIGGFAEAQSNHTVGLGGDRMLSRAAGSPEANTFVKLSRSFKNMHFADVSSPEVVDSLVSMGLPQGTSMPFMAVINPYAGEHGRTAAGSDIFDSIFTQENRVVLFDEPLADFNKAKEFLRKNNFPQVIPFSSGRVPEVFSDGRPIFCLFTDEKNPRARENIDALLPAAQKFRDKMLFIVSYKSGELDGRLKTVTGAAEEALPTFRLFTVNPIGHHSWTPLLKYAPDTSLRASLSADGILKFVENYFAGKVKPNMKSEEELSEEDQGAVRVVVGTNFDREVRQSDKDVFIVFAAPWCGHCRRFEPTLLELGDHLKNTESIIIARIDASANEIPGMHIPGYPTMILFPAGNKGHPIYYRGDRTIPDLLKFLGINSTTKFDGEGMASRIANDEPPLARHDDPAGLDQSARPQRSGEL